MELATTYKYDVVIVGAGPAGMCAGMYAGRSMLKSVVLERGFPGGELLNTELIEDYPGFETILGHELAQKFADHAAKFGAEFKNGVVVEGVRKREDGMLRDANRVGRHLRVAGRDHHGGRHAGQARHPRRDRVCGEGRVVLRDLRRRVLPQPDDRRRRRRRRGNGGSGLPHALRRQGVSHPSPRRAARVEDPAAAPVRQSEDRSHLEHRRRRRSRATSRAW